MARIFQSFVMEKEFENLYKVLIPKLNKCGNCGSTKCFRCNLFDDSCIESQHFRRKDCVKFINSIKFFYENAKDEEWNYVCNFLHNLFRVSDITRTNFTDISEPIQFPISKTAFIVSSVRNSFLKFKKDGCIYYLLGDRRYSFYPKSILSFFF